MADDETQGPEDSSWGAFDAFPDSQLPSVGFDEPLVWPESAVWDDLAEPPVAGHLRTEDGAIFPPVHTIDVVAEAGPSPDFDDLWRPADDGPADDGPADDGPADDGPADDGPVEHPVDREVTVQRLGPLAGLGGGSRATGPDRIGNVPWAVPVDEHPTDVREVGSPHVEAPTLGSIWSNQRRGDPQELVGFGGLAAPAIYAEKERNAGGSKWRRFDVRPGNAAVIGLISVVSLVLLGMFLSVRARNNDVPTDASQTRPLGNEVAVTGPLNTIPTTTSITTTSTTTAPAPIINLSELAATETTAGAATGTSAGSGSATTTPPATRAATPSGGGSATTTPVTTATTAPPPPTTAATSPPAAPVENETTETTRRPTPTFTIPTFPSIPFSIPTITAPRAGGLSSR